MAAPTPHPSSSAIDVDVTTFEREVIVRSQTVPVLVDLWATWCGPCKTLSPVLEKLAREMSGRLVLAKIDIDQNPELAEAFQVQNVPTVMLLKNGQVVDGFVGAQPEAEIRRVLERHLGPAANPLESAEALEKEGRVEEAIDLLRAHLRARGDDAAARLVLARLLLDQGQADEARRTFDLLSPADQEGEAGAALAARFAFQQHAAELDTLARRVEAEPEDLGARVAWGRALVAAGKHEQGLEVLFDAAKRDVHHDGDAPRKAMIEAFGVIGWSNALVREYQRRLSLILAS